MKGNVATNRPPTTPPKPPHIYHHINNRIVVKSIIATCEGRKFNSTTGFTDTDMGAYMHVNRCVGEPFYGSLTLNVTIVYGFLEEYIPQDRVE